MRLPSLRRRVRRIDSAPVHSARKWVFRQRAGSVDDSFLVHQNRLRGHGRPVPASQHASDAIMTTMTDQSTSAAACTTATAAASSAAATDGASPRLEELRRNGAMDQIVAGQAKLLERWNRKPSATESVTATTRTRIDERDPTLRQPNPEQGMDTDHRWLYNSTARNGHDDDAATTVSGTARRHGSSNNNSNTSHSSFRHRDYHQSDQESVHSARTAVSTRRRRQHQDQRRRLQNGQTLRLLDRRHAIEAVENGTACVYQCAGCQKKLLAGGNVKLVYCAHCGTVTPTHLSRTPLHESVRGAF